MAIDFVALGRLHKTEARIAKLEAALKQAALELKEAGNVISANLPHVADLFHSAANNALGALKKDERESVIIVGDLASSIKYVRDD